MDKKQKKNTGVVEISSRNKATVYCEQNDTQYHLPFDNLNGALDKDQVSFFLIKRKNRIKADVVAIMKRHKKKFVGTIQTYKKDAFFLPDDKNARMDFYIAKKDLHGAKNSDKVVVLLKDTKKKSKNPHAEVIKIIGKKGMHHTEIHSILEYYELPYEFSDKVLKEAEFLDFDITQQEIKKRKDFRNILTFTIDPQDAKDFDDAISFEVLGEGIYNVGIHIADVSHYVQKNSLLDREAYKRATSIYLVDRVVPMLPEILSNEVCSLKPHEEKLTFSAVFKIDKNGQVMDQWFGKTIIYSDKRLTYEQAQEIIENKNKVGYDKKITQAVLKLNDLAQKMRGERMSKGAISFDGTQVHFQLDAQNNPLNVYLKTSKDAHKLIEEFMLLANKKVAEFIGKKIKKTLIYRIHDIPDQEKLVALKDFVRKFGYKFHTEPKENISKNINDLLEQVKESPESNIIATLVISCMSKALYSTENIGHYGLSFDYYTHFTSPIRRYCDLIVHRLLDSYLKKSYKTSENYQAKSKHISEMEILAVKAERDSNKYMQIKYMQNQHGKIFEAMITGITHWGIYAEIVKNKCEGMVLLRDIKEDYYTFDPSDNTIVGQRTKKQYQLGDKIFVKLKKADLEKKHLDFYCSFFK